MAYLGQFQNTTAILTMFATGAIASGVVKYLAQYKNDPIKRQEVVNAATLIVLCCSLVISLIVMAVSGYLSMAAFKTTDFWMVYLLFGLFLTTVSFNVIFAALLNGLNEIKRLTIINISSSLIGICLTVLFAYYFGVKGVLLSGTALSVILFSLYLFLFRKAGIQWKPNFKKVNRQVMKLLLRFTLMAVVSGLLVPTIQILVRDKIIIDFSTDEAGYWQAVTKISDYYLSFITMVLSVYYMPKISGIEDRKELRTEILQGYKLVIPTISLLALLIWLAKGIIIQLLFSPAFEPMKPLFTFQLLGDVFKIGSWLLAMIMIAKAMVKIYIVTEIIFAALYVFLSYYFINRYGLVGATYGFCLNYAIYWITMAFIMKKKF